MRGASFMEGAARRFGALAALGVALALLGAASLRTAVGSGSVALSSGSPISAMNAYALFELSAKHWGRQLAAMRASGVELVRTDVDWGTIEPQAPSGGHHSWRFSYYDGWVKALAMHRLTWQPILDDNSPWAQAVKKNAAFAAFGQAVAARYGENGSFWVQHPKIPYEPAKIFEVWNEENAKPAYVSELDYGPLYAATRAAIHSADPQASVDVGGLADDSQNFNPNDDYPARYIVRMLLLRPALRGHIDGFALHPYGTAASDVIDWVTDFRRVLDQFHEGSAPIDITEFGWVTGDSATEAWRAAQMTAVGLAFSHSTLGIREVAPYDWVNPVVLNEIGDFGFVDPSAVDTVLRPAAEAWFHAFTPAGRCQSGGLDHQRRGHATRPRSACSAA